MARNCSYNYKGEVYSEEEVKPIVSYHYMVEDAVLQSNSFEKIGNVIISKEGVVIPRQTENVFNTPSVKFTLKSIDILNKLTSKQQQEWNKFNKGTVTAEQLVNNLQIPKEQKELVIGIINNLDKPTAQEVAVELANKYSYIVEINTAKEEHDGDRTNYWFENKDFFYSLDQDSGKYYKWSKKTNKTYTPLESEFEISKEQYLKELKETQSKATQYYSNLTVPGGTNYTENEIATPAITPSIKGHAQFSTDKGIGWFRSDDKHPFTGFLEDLIASGTIKKVPCG